MARSIPAQVIVTSERQGTVRVRAKPLSGREGDARPLCGFDGARRRYAGEVFLITEPQEFSPRWMDFVDASGKVIDPPEAWKDIVGRRRAELEELIVSSRTPQLEALRKQNGELAQQYSMAQVQARENGSKAAALETENAKLRAELEAAKSTKK
jgi:hypothetical protein